MARAKPLFSSRSINLYLSLNGVRRVLTTTYIDGGCRQRWLVKPVTSMLTSTGESQWLSKQVAAHARVVLMVDGSIDPPGSRCFSKLLKWLLAILKRLSVAVRPC